MSEIKIPKEAIEQIVLKLKAYFNDELSQDIGGFEAEFLIDFSTSLPMITRNL